MLQWRWHPTELLEMDNKALVKVRRSVSPDELTTSATVSQLSLAANKTTANKWFLQKNKVTQMT